jgi:hypothetical protein
VRRRSREAGDSETRPQCSGEQSCPREGRGKEGKLAGEVPYPTAELLRWLAEAKKRRSSENDGDRSMKTGKLRVIRVSWAGTRLWLGEELGHGGRLNRAAGAPRRAGPGLRAMRAASYAGRTWT